MAARTILDSCSSQTVAHRACIGGERPIALPRGRVTVKLADGVLADAELGGGACEAAHPDVRAQDPEASAGQRLPHGQPAFRSSTGHTLGGAATLSSTAMR